VSIYCCLILKMAGIVEAFDPVPPPLTMAWIEAACISRILDWGRTAMPGPNPTC